MDKEFHCAFPGVRQCKKQPAPSAKEYANFLAQTGKSDHTLALYVRRDS